MTVSAVEVVAPSRLHFGLLSFGDSTVRQYGGIGVMVEQPALHVRVTPASSFAVTGKTPDRIREIVQRWAESRGLRQVPDCHVELLTAPRCHIGLGAGTQLALSLATALNTLCGFAAPSAWQLAMSVGRGLRSAVGTYGFAHGGLLLERGKMPSETIAPLERRVELPAEWRFVLICSRQGEGLSGDAEKRAFQSLPPLSRDITEQLSREIHNHMLPAASTRQFDAFSESVYRFGYQAGLCFAEIQGGAFNGPRVQELIKQIHACRVRGVGQSSWGPTVYAVCRSQSEADQFVRLLQQRRAIEDAEVCITATSNTGARIHVEH